MSSLHFFPDGHFLLCWFGFLLICFVRDTQGDTSMAFLKVESSDWQEAHPGRVPIRRCGDVSLPFAAQDLGLTGRGQGVESHLAGLEEGDPGSSQRCLKDERQLTYRRCFYLNCMSSLLNFIVFNNLYITSSKLCACWRSPRCWWGSGWTQFVMSEQVVQLGRA